MSDLSLPFESKYLPLKRLHDEYRRSIDQPEEFWAEQASIGDLSTLEDKAAVEEVIISYQEMEQAQTGIGQQK